MEGEGERERGDIISMTATTHQGVFPGEEEEGWSVFTSSSAPDGGCVCTVVAPGNNLCGRDSHSHQTQLLDLQVRGGEGGGLWCECMCVWCVRM